MEKRQETKTKIPAIVELMVYQGKQAISVINKYIVPLYWVTVSWYFFSGIRIMIVKILNIQ